MLRLKSLSLGGLAALAIGVPTVAEAVYVAALTVEALCHTQSQIQPRQEALVAPRSSPERSF